MGTIKKFKPNVLPRTYLSMGEFQDYSRETPQFHWISQKGRSPNFIEYLKNTTAESQTDTVSMQYVSNSILWNASRDLNVFIIQREN